MQLSRIRLTTIAYIYQSGKKLLLVSYIASTIKILLFATNLLAKITSININYSFLVDPYN